MTADQPLSEYLKTCSDREYAEYIISTMCGKNPQEWDTAKKEAIEAIRSRPVPAASGLTSTPSDRRGCLTCFDPDCPVWQTADQTCWKGLSEHAAAIRKDERERVLNKLFPKSHSGESGWRYDLKFLSHLEFKIEERNEYHFQCEDIEEILTVLEESLRAGDE